MTIRDKKKVPIACCPLCGGKELEALEQYEITDSLPGFVWFVHGRFRAYCEKCFCHQDVDFQDDAQSKEEALFKTADAFKDFENHWARKDYVEVKDAE